MAKATAQPGPARTAEIFARFQAQNPHPHSELAFSSPFQLLVAVVLSAQCTDERINKVTKALFAAYPTPQTMAQAGEKAILDHIKSVTYPNSKARYLADLSTQLVALHHGQVPDDLAALEALPGVGHKTASVVLAVAFGKPALPVDTHVLRVANRLGLVHNANTPQKVEKQLKALLPEDSWAHAHHWLLLHGRYVCKAQRPNCNQCFLADLCPNRQETPSRKGKTNP